MSASFIDLKAQYTVLVSDRDEMKKRLSGAGIPTAVHCPGPLNKQLAYNHMFCPNCAPIAQQIAKRVLSLPVHVYSAVFEVT